MRRKKGKKIIRNKTKMTKYRTSKNKQEKQDQTRRIIKQNRNTVHRTSTSTSATKTRLNEKKEKKYKTTVHGTSTSASLEEREKKSTFHD